MIGYVVDQQLSRNYALCKHTLLLQSHYLLKFKIINRRLRTLTLLLSVPLELRITFLIYSMFKPNTGKSGLQFCLMMISKTLKSLDCFRVTLAVVIEKDALFAGIEIATRKRSKGES